METILTTVQNSPVLAYPAQWSTSSVTKMTIMRSCTVYYLCLTPAVGLCVTVCVSLLEMKNDLRLELSTPNVAGLARTDSEINSGLICSEDGVRRSVL